jgi:hypothetical protein
MSTRLALAQRFLDEHKCGDDVIAIAIWTVADVMAKAKKMKVRLTKKEAVSVLWDVERFHRADEGINWSTIEISIRAIIQEREQKPVGR